MHHTWSNGQSQHDLSCGSVSSSICYNSKLAPVSCWISERPIHTIGFQERRVDVVILCKLFSWWYRSFRSKALFTCKIKQKITPVALQNVVATRWIRLEWISQSNGSIGRPLGFVIGRLNNSAWLYRINLCLRRKYAPKKKEKKKKTSQVSNAIKQYYRSKWERKQPGQWQILLAYWLFETLKGNCAVSKYLGWLDCWYVSWHQTSGSKLAK